MVSAALLTLLTAGPRVTGGSATHAPTDFPAPFSRVLKLTSPEQAGKDVTILQNLLSHPAAGSCRLGCAGPAGGAGVLHSAGSAGLHSAGNNCTGLFDQATATSLACFQATAEPTRDAAAAARGQLDPSTAAAVLARLSDDGWRDDGLPAGPRQVALAGPWGWA